MTQSVTSRHLESRRGSIRGENFAVWQFVSQRNGEATRACSNIGDAQYSARQSRIHMDLQAAWTEPRQSYFHHMLGLRPRNQHCGRYLEFEAPEFLLAGKILRRLSCRTACDQRTVFVRISSFEQHLRMRVEPSAIAPEPMYKQKFCGERMRRDARCAQLRHSFFQCPADIDRLGIYIRN